MFLLYLTIQSAGVGFKVLPSLSPSVFCINTAGSFGLKKRQISAVLNYVWLFSSPLKKVLIDVVRFFITCSTLPCHWSRNGGRLHGCVTALRRSVAKKQTGACLNIQYIHQAFQTMSFFSKVSSTERARQRKSFSH